jgi:cyclase
MYRPRVIPVLLLKGAGLVKTVQFADPKYVGDPVNAVKIFNEKEVDELILVDITATAERRPPRLKTMAEVASECFMPVCCGGGIRTLDDAKALFGVGIEKVALNTSAVETPQLIGEIATLFGSQSVIVSIDVRRDRRGRPIVFSRAGSKDTGLDPATHARRVAEAGAGEILLTSIDRDGTRSGYDLPLVQAVTAAVTLPVIACGGAGSLGDLRDVVRGGAAAAAAGTFFVLQGRHRAVLITAPTATERARAFAQD